MTIYYGFIALRPKQWVKNVLIFVAPFAAGKIFIPEFKNALMGFCAFSIVASLGYILNDLNDIEIDRSHPKKRSRPFASRALGFSSGVFLVFLLTIVLLIIIKPLPTSFKLILGTYLINSMIYTKMLKKIPVLEMFSVAFGFVLRLISGALVMDLMISEWFLIVGGFGALFLVSAKRLAELKQDGIIEVRHVVSSYTKDFLVSCINISLGICITAYCFWAFAQSPGAVWYQFSVIPFVIALFRYRWMCEGTAVEAPEDALFSDRQLLTLGFFSLSLLAIAIFHV